MILTITEISSVVKIVNHTYATLLGPITPHAANLGLITHHADNLGPITNKGIPLCHLVISFFLTTIPTLIPLIVILSMGSFINILKRRSSNCGFKGTLQKNSFNLTFTWYTLALHLPPINVQ